MVSDSHLEVPGTSPFARPAWFGWLLVALIFAVGLGVRLYDLADPPMDFHPTRQFHSALIARGMYYESMAVAPEWQREMALRQWHSEGLIEPQILERLVAWTYRLAGGPALWIPRLYSIMFWMIGAGLLAALAAERVGMGGMVMTAFFFLIWPYGVFASRAFQPDPLMVALIAASLWAGFRWERRATWGWTVAAGLLAGLAIYIKSVAVFFIAPAFAALVLWGPGPRRAIRDPKVWTLGVLAVLPYAIYHIDGVYVRGFLVDQFSQRFFPEMWLDPAFYLRWVSNLSRAIPVEVCLVALLGALLLPLPVERAVLLGMWLGYVACGMALSHHISTHDYYHLPLFVLVSLGLGAVAETVFRSLRGPAWLVRWVAIGVVLVGLTLVGYEARTTLKRSDYRAEAALWEETGVQLGPGAAVVVLTPDYGTGLAYWGWIAPTNWPTQEDLAWRAGIGQEETFEARFQALAASRSYFVIYPLEELAQQPDLETYLAEHYPVLRDKGGLRIYDLRNPLER